jgi:hypothetical protein
MTFVMTSAQMLIFLSSPFGEAALGGEWHGLEEREVHHQQMSSKKSAEFLPCISRVFFNNHLF